jgi:hypothetical protein
MIQPFSLWRKKEGRGVVKRRAAEMGPAKSTIISLAGKPAQWNLRYYQTYLLFAPGWCRQIPARAN